MLLKYFLQEHKTMNKTKGDVLLRTSAYIVISRQVSIALYLLGEKIPRF